MKSIQDVCAIISEIVSTGVEKALDTTDTRHTYKDFALVLSHKVSKVPWDQVHPPLSDLGLI